MIRADSLRIGFYAAIVAVILTLTGIFGEFQRRDVIAGTLNLSTLLLAIFITSAGYFAAWRAYRAVSSGKILAALPNGAIGGLIVALALAGVVVVQKLVNPEGLRFVFQSLNELSGGPLTFGRPITLRPTIPVPLVDGAVYFNQYYDITGLLLLLIAGVLGGAVAGLIFALSQRLRETLLLALGLTAVLGLLQQQISEVITLPDAIAIAVTLGVGYWLGLNYSKGQFSRSLLLGVAVGVIAAVIVILIIALGGLESGTRGADGVVTGIGVLRGRGSLPRVLNLPTNIPWGIILFVAGMIVVGAVGALTPRADRGMHNAVWMFSGALLVMGVLNSQRGMNLPSAVLTFGILFILLWLLSPLSEAAQKRHDVLPATERRSARGILFIGLIIVALIAPLFMGQNIANVFNRVALYIMLGIGLNIMVGYAGLLDLGYVAAFAVGAYGQGVFTTPNLITCGVDASTLTAEQIPQVCTGVMNFWAALPLTILLATLVRVVLGVPVLRLRGDYLAIVTLGFGEIINRLIRFDGFKPVLGSAQGITPIPFPRIDLGFIDLNGAEEGGQLILDFSGATSAYYLFLLMMLLTWFVVARLVHVRLGRGWRALRADEDVAQAMGMNLTSMKLLAFAISSAIGGLGGALNAAYVQGAFPNSFTILVSINVLSLIIIGGLGSIRGVVIGSIILIGLPEVLRELDAYRLLAFGALLVVVMLLKPDGLLPPSPPKLEARGEELAAREGAKA